MQKELIILDEDKAFAQARIAELQQEIQNLGPEFYEVFNQSSETWHDNAPFDALRDRQSLLDAELQQLRTIIRNSALRTAKPKKGRVGIGCAVTLSNKKSYFVAGDWTPRAGKVENGAMVISCQAPLAVQLLNKKVGDSVQLGKMIATIDHIDSR